MAGAFLLCVVISVGIAFLFGRIGLMDRNGWKLAFALSVTWVAWSGHVEPMILGFGVASVLLTVLIASRMQIVDEEGVPLAIHTLRSFSYIPWLIGQVVMSNIDVARRIWVMDPTSKLEPSMLSVQPTQKTFVGRVLYANSITLTPGTVSVRMLDDEILVHALHQGTADDVTEGTMNRKVTALERPGKVS